ncbi:uncharacterized protein LOC106356230 isoform X1 [Brassica napus]|uniref:uncharacterized protein LOC106356230 isoform X1 n=1 Tax=Brassica napus TaxID=3708 RepID=UPI0006AAC813|nr:uncharacterized protein LOC106356230 isoform X1 [Brassica napus]XP_048601770.1 uncharacterized protein LOC106356230 isoform X1 [Brassica napus]
MLSPVLASVSLEKLLECQSVAMLLLLKLRHLQLMTMMTWIILVTRLRRKRKLQRRGRLLRRTPRSPKRKNWYQLVTVSRSSRSCSHNIELTGPKFNRPKQFSICEEKVTIL